MTLHIILALVALTIFGLSRIPRPVAHAMMKAGVALTAVTILLPVAVLGVMFIYCMITAG